MKLAFLLLFLCLVSITISRKSKKTNSKKKGVYYSNYSGGSSSFGSSSSYVSDGKYAISTAYTLPPTTTYYSSSISPLITTFPTLISPNEAYTAYMASPGKNLSEEIEVYYKYKGAILLEHSYKIGGVEMSSFSSTRSTTGVVPRLKMKKAKKARKLKKN